MLAPHDDPQKKKDFFQTMRFPLLISPKLDGIRNTVKNDPVQDFHSLTAAPSVAGGVAYKCKSRDFIDLPSIQVQSFFSDYHELDGELVEGNETDPGLYNRTQSYVMSAMKPSDSIAFRVFDIADEKYKNTPFYERLLIAEDLVVLLNIKHGQNVSVIEHIPCESVEELLVIEDRFLEMGYEGIMARDPLGPYKWGRATWDEGYLYKVKRFAEFEARVIGFEEQMTNTNADVRSNLDKAKRSTAKAGMVPADTLGKFIVDYHGTPIKVSCGILKHPQRKEIWANQEKYLGEDIVVRHFPHGMKDLPRHGRFVGFRKKGF